MKPFILILLLTVSLQEIFAQKPASDKFTATDKMVLQLPDSLTHSPEQIAGYIKTHFQTEELKVRAVFIWLASNISYDVENMYAFNFYEKREDKIKKTLQTRKGICEGYAALFHDICSLSGINTYIVEGYTKQNGYTDYLPHAWCAARINDNWCLFDPTWGAGYVDHQKFYRKINNEYFMATPQFMIKSHMPFDYLWQCLNYPITNQEFYEGKFQENKNKPFFSVNDSITAFLKLNPMQQLKASSERIEKNGVKNSMIADRLYHIKSEIENARMSKIIDLYNQAAGDYNDGINAYNNFINYRNQQFQPMRPDPEIQAMLDLAENKFKEAENTLNQIRDPDTNTANLIHSVQKSLQDANVQLDEQKTWLKIYFSKGKTGRRNMFYERKITVFGIPVN